MAGVAAPLDRSRGLAVSVTIQASMDSAPSLRWLLFAGNLPHQISLRLSRIRGRLRPLI
jgi:hypothetical protein